MPFSNPRSQIETKSQVAAKKERLKEEVSVLNSALGEMKALQDEFDLTAEDVSELKDIRKDLTSQVTKKNFRIKELDAEISEKQDVVTQFNKKQEELSLLDIEISGKKSVSDELGKQNSSLEGQKSSLLSEIQVLKAEQDALTKSIQEATQKHQDDTNDVEQKKSSLEVVLSELEGSIALKRMELSEIEGAIYNKRLELDTAQKELVSLVSNKVETLAQYDLQLDKKKEAVEKEIAEKEALWTEKSGELSLRERQIEQVTQKLQVAKRKLEEQYGRQFNDIII